MTTVINLLGGSGLGKSTTAALVFGEMKLAGLHCELVREFVKEWAWAGRKIGPDDQAEIYANQLAREKIYYGKLDYIVTDSPLLLSPIYQKYYNGSDPIAAHVLRDLNAAKESGVVHLNFLLTRNKPYDERGRYETAQQAGEVDNLVRHYLETLELPFYTITTNDRERVNEIINLAVAQRAA